MAKVKISEFSSTPGSNTDIDGINIAENCPPSGINDAIRELMAQLKDWQSGTSNDPYVVGSSGSLTLSYGTANGVAYLNGSKVLTTGSALTFDGTSLGVGTTPTSYAGYRTITLAGNTGAEFDFKTNGVLSGYLESSSSLMKFFVPTSSNFVWDIGSEQMRLTFTGLGIGTSSPTEKLHVAGALRVTGAQTTAGTGVYLDQTSGTGGVSVYGPDNSTQGTFRIYTATANGGTGSTKLTLDSSGNLGLGVTPTTGGYGGGLQISRDPASNLLTLWTQPINTNDHRVSLTNNAKNTGVGTWAYNASSQSATMYQQMSGVHQWWTAGTGTAGNAISFTQAMSLTAAGELLVGTTSAVNSSFVGVVFDAATKNGLVLRTSANTSGAGFALFADNSGNTCGNIFRVGTTSAVTYAATSDYRLKTVIGPVANSGQRIDALKPVEYIWKNGGERTRGFLAHQFQEVYAGSVNGNKDAVDAEGKPVYQSMQASTAEVIADLVSEIQSLRKRVAALESK